MIGGSTVAIAASVVLHAPLGVAAGAGGAVGLVSLALPLRHAARLLEKRAGNTESILPSPADA